MSNHHNHHKTKKHPIVYHATQPHGITVIIATLFVLGWAVWTFIIW